MKTVLKKIIKMVGLQGARSSKQLLIDVQRTDPSATLDQGVLTSLGLKLNPVDDFWIVQALPIFSVLVEHLGFRLEKSEKHVRATRGQVTFEVQSSIEAGILQDIYGRSVYRLITDKPYLIVDVGANIGVSAIYHASEFGAEVHGFELVPQVANRAADHVKSNHLDSLVTIYPFGLGRVDQEINVPFSDDLTGGTSLHNFNNVNPEAGTVKCKVCCVESSVRSILAGSTKEKFVKMDCEGAEYEILESLDESGLLKEFSGFLMEYHEISDTRNRIWLEQFFSTRGFYVHSMTKPGFNHEMLYAFRR